MLIKEGNAVALLQFSTIHRLTKTSAMIAWKY